MENENTAAAGVPCGNTYVSGLKSGNMAAAGQRKMGRGRAVVIAGAVGAAGVLDMLRSASGNPESDSRRGVSGQTGALSLRERFGESFTARALRYCEQTLDAEERACRILSSAEDFVLVRAGAGGICAALWELCETAGTGLEAELFKIPVRQEWIEICEYMDHDPYLLDAGGSLAAAFGEGADTAGILRELTEAGIPAEVIGYTTDKKARVLRYSEVTRYLSKPRPAVSLPVTAGEEM